MHNIYKLDGARTFAGLDPLSLGRLWPGLTVTTKRILFYIMLLASYPVLWYISDVLKWVCSIWHRSTSK